MYLILQFCELIDYTFFKHTSFRLPGRQSAIKDVISRFERGQKIRFESEGTDVHVVASVFKTFLRDLPDSIIPCKLFQKFMNIALRFMEGTDESLREACVQELAEAMTLVPKDNYVILKYICRFLREVRVLRVWFSYVEINRNRSAGKKKTEDRLSFLHIFFSLVFRSCKCGQS